MQKNQKAAEALNEKQEDVLRMLKEITAAVKKYGKGERSIGASLAPWRMSRKS